MRFAGEGHVRSRWVWALAVVLAVCFSGTATAAFATDPVSLGDEHVVDQANVLSASDEAAANDRLDQLYADTGVDLYVAIVDDFTNPADRQQWADAVASQNGLGAKQYVLVISTDGRQYYISADSSGPLSESQIASAEQAIQTQLRDGDYLAAITTGADRFTDDLTGAGGGFTVILVVILIAGAAFLIIWLIVRSRRKGKTSAVTGDGSPQAPAVPLQELERQASSALIATDDALKTSNQELGFATAQFGDAATSEFVTVIAHARADLDEAFALQQQLDDDVPDTEQQRRDWNTRIIELCAHANTELDEKAADFDELRKLEANAPEALARVQQDRTRVGGGVEAAATQLSALGAVYAPEALVTIADNPEQAKQRIEFADEQLASAQRAIGSGDGATAAVSIRAAEDAVAQAELLDAAIAKFAADLAQGETDAAALIANLEGDIAAASALPDPDGRVAGAIAATRQQIDSARTHLAGDSTSTTGHPDRTRGGEHDHRLGDRERPRRRRAGRTIPADAGTARCRRLKPRSLPPRITSPHAAAPWAPKRAPDSRKPAHRSCRRSSSPAPTPTGRWRSLSARTIWPRRRSKPRRGMSAVSTAACSAEADRSSPPAATACSAPCWAASSSTRFSAAAAGAPAASAAGSGRRAVGSDPAASVAAAPAVVAAAAGSRDDDHHPPLNFHSIRIPD